MVAILTKTLVEERRLDWCLQVSNGGPPEEFESVVIEYVPHQLPERTLHREAVDRSFGIIAAKGWNPTYCTWRICRRVESNCPRQLQWWEPVRELPYSEALQVIAGRRVILIPVLAPETQEVA